MGRLIRFYYRLGFVLGRKYTDALTAQDLTRARLIYGSGDHGSRVASYQQAGHRVNSVVSAYNVISRGLADKRIFFSGSVRRELSNNFARGYFDARDGRPRS